MLMSLFKWEARILNKLYKTERYDKLIQMQLTSPEQINYQTFFQITPDVQIPFHSNIIEASNKLCRPSTRALQMQQFVAYLDQYVKKINQQSQIQKSIKNIELQEGNKNNYRLEHVVVYSCLSKCRIWPKVLKSGIGFVPNLINFYNSFTKQYSDLLDFKFDPVILTQKYTKIMKKAHMKKKDNPKLIQAIKNNDIQSIKNILFSIKHKYKEQNKNQIQTQIQQKQQFNEIINNISHKGLAVSHICAQYSNIEVIKYLASLGTNFQLLDDQKQTAIFYTIKRADLTIVKFFVQQLKVNLNHREYQDRTVFYLAAFQGELQIVEYLYKSGADPQLCSKLDRTPLSKACYLGNISVVKYLLEIKVDILKQDNKGRTALHNAVWGIKGGRDGKRRGHIMLQDSPECAQLLIQAGHPIDFQDYDGFTPFFSAVSSRAIRSMRLLINYKTNIYHKTKNQQTAVFIAAKYGHVAALKILVQQLDLSFLQPDYHGYTPLCASFTLEQPQTCSYLLDLYMKNGLSMQVQKIVECCKHYETVKNINFIRHWLKDNENNSVGHIQKIIYLSQNLRLIIKTFIKLKKQKTQIKQSIQLLQRSLTQKYLIENQTTLQNKKKIEQQKYKFFENLITNKIEQQQFTQDHEKQITKIQQKNKQVPKDKQKQAIFQTKNNKKKQLTSIKDLSNFLLQIAVYIVKQLQLYIKSQLNLKSLQNNEQNLNNLRLKYIKNYSRQEYKQVIIIILSEYVHAFNKGKHCLDDIVQGILELGTILDSNNPMIPPKILTQYSNSDNKQMFFGSLLSEYLYLINEQQLKASQFSHKQTGQEQLINTQNQNQNPKSQFLKQKHLLIHNLCKIKLNHHQNQSQILKLITNNQVVTNLIQNEEQLLHSLFKLAKFRQTGIIIGIFNRGQNIGNISYQRLVDIVSGRLTPNVNTHKISKAQQNKITETQILQQKNLTLIQYCVLHGISDIAVFLQQICKSPQTPLLVEIPKYQIQRINLSQEQIKVQLQSIDEWTFNLKQILSRMNEKQRNVYKKFININKILNKEESQQSIQNNKLDNKQFVQFQTCHNYHIIDTKQKLAWLQKVLNQSILIGIDVEHYNVTKQEYFICSVQISNGKGVYILDTLSHLKNIKNSAQQQKIMKQEFRQQSLNPQLISNFIRKLMNDKSKIKIFHAYENDVKWLHEDFNLSQRFVDSNQKMIGQASRVQNVVDTCKIYGLLHKTKKSQSVGLRTLCQKYIGYKMDKSFQRSDWRIRPLFNQMIQYAAIDAQVLPYVYLRMLQQESQSRIKQKFKSNFCIKRQISGRGIRNKLVPEIQAVQQLK